MAQCTSCKEPNEYQDQDFLCRWCKYKGKEESSSTSEPLFMWTYNIICEFEKILAVTAYGVGDSCRLCKEPIGSHFGRSSSAPWACPNPDSGIYTGSNTGHKFGPNFFVPTNLEKYNIAKSLLKKHGQLVRILGRK